ncbi:MAG: tyrosine-type recombinase/integrase [Planctomycetota bacterium]
MKLGSNTNQPYLTDDTVRIEDRMRSFHVPVKYLEDVTPAVIEGFITRRILESGIAPKTANRYREILHVMFNYAIRTRNFVSLDRRYPNPAAAVQRRNEPPLSIRFLSAEEITYQLSVLGSHPTIQALVATYIYAGLRREEALWLTHDDVDLERRLIRVVAKTVDEEFWQPKTKRNRVVPVSSALVQALQAHVPKRACRWYFPSPAGGRWDPDNFSQDLRAINSKHGLSWSCLDFRHTFGSHLAQKGESLYKIAELMGNSPEICRRHYAALQPERMHDVVEFEKPQAPGATDALLQKVLARLDQVVPQQVQSQLRVAT